MTTIELLAAKHDRALSGIERVVLPFLRGVLLAFLGILAYGVINHTVEAAQSSKVAEQAATIKALSGLLEKCLSPGDHPITIGDELWFCGAANSGIKK